MTKNETKKFGEQGEVVLVTGASSGIGLAICKELVALDYYVIGCARNFDKTDFVHENFERRTLDLSKLDSISVEFKNLLTALDRPVKALVNNVGTGKMGYLEQLSESDIRDTMNLNFISHVMVTKSLLPALKQQEGCSDIIFIGSEAALQGAQQGSIYCASKFALRGFAQALRQECAKSAVRVTLINPGAVRTGFFADLSFEPGDSPDNAIEPEDVASVVSEILQMRAGTVVDEVNLSPLKRVWQTKNS